MPLLQGQVGTQLAQDGDTNRNFRQGRLAEQIVSELHGKYYEQARLGNVFFISTVAAGLAVPISSTTAPTVMLWNPSGSGKNASLIKFTCAYASGTSVATAIGLMVLTGLGSAIATGTSITAFNQSALGTNLFNALLGSGTSSIMKSSANGVNTIVAGTWLLTMFGESALVATTAMNPYSVVYDFDGTLILPPGTAVYVAGTAASGALLTQSLVWEEIPV